MPKSKRTKRLLIVLAAAGILVVVVALSFPIWLPWIVRPVAERANLSYESYHRDGFSSLTLSNVQTTNAGVVFSADEVEVLTPPNWLLKLRKSTDTNTANVARIRGWNLTIPAGETGETNAQVLTNSTGTNAPRGGDGTLPGATNAAALQGPFILHSQVAASPAQSLNGAALPDIPDVSGTTKASTSLYTNVQQILNTLQSLRRWAPGAVLEQGTATVQHVTILLPTVTWSNNIINADLVLPEQDIRAKASVNLTDQKAPIVSVQSRDLELLANINLELKPSQLQVNSSAFWRSNEISLRAEFDREGVIPQTASLIASNFVVPSALLKTEMYLPIEGSLSADWDSNQFNLKLNASADPAPTNSSMPAIVANLNARGTTNYAVLESFNISSPYLSAALSRDLRINFVGTLVEEPAFFNFSADLSEQGVLPVAGLLRGQAVIVPAQGKYPVVRFNADGSNVTYLTFTAQSLQANGTLDYPVLELGGLNVDIGGTLQAVLGGIYNLTNNIIADGRFTISGTVPQQLLSTNLALEKVVATGGFSGSVTGLIHSGRIEVGKLKPERVRPLTVEAEWSADHLNLTNVSAIISSEGATLSINAAVNPMPPEVSIHLNDMALRTNNTMLLRLREPAQLVLKNSTSGHWRVSSTPFHWSGAAGEIQFQANANWPESGSATLNLQDIRSFLLSTFLPEDIGTWTVENLKLSAEWDRAPAVFTLYGSAVGTLPNATEDGFPGEERSLLSLPLSLRIAAGGDARGVTLTNLSLLALASAGGDLAPVVEAAGTFPLSFNFLATNALTIRSNEPISFSLQAASDSLLWPEVGRQSGVRFAQPDLIVDLGGTLARPSGSARLSLGEVQVPGLVTNAPVIRNVVVALAADQEQLQIAEGQLNVEGQQITFGGSYPLGAEFWEQVQSGNGFDWTKAAAWVRVPNADIAPFARLLPAVLMPAGEMDLNLAVKPGLRLEGRFVIGGAAVRPIQNLGSLQNINLDLRFQEQSGVIEKVSANLGGAPITMTGVIDLSGTNWMTGELPPMNLKVQGENVPLSRQPELILRTDLNATVIKTNGAAPLITGAAKLRNSYFLADLASLVGPGVAGPIRRAPYFSIDEPFLAPFRLDMRVTGPSFIRVQSPVFRGVASANLRLTGTLGEPMALGDIQIESGAVRFPFASLQVQSGRATLSSEDPYRPQLAVTASAMRFGYDITMNVTGPADDPIIQFTSTPPLSSQRILLMVTAGQLPGTEQIYSTEQRAQSFALFLGRDLLTKLGIGGEGEERLIIQTGERISDEGKPTYRVEYRLTDRWSLVGEYDRFNEFNMGTKWRVYSR